jgi:nitrate reductase gamma subunit
VSETPRIIASVSILWAIVILIAQFLYARGNRKDYSVRAGSPIKGVIYNFTWAMTPWHKETIRLHPVEFTIGVLMHIGVLAAIGRIFILVIYPSTAEFKSVVVAIVLGIAILSGLYLLIRRIFSPEMRSISNPEDYFAIIMTFGLLITAMAHELSLISTNILLIYAAILFFYSPLGKLNHGMFFIAARADFGARLGYRGVYPARHNTHA